MTVPPPPKTPPGPLKLVKDLGEPRKHRERPGDRHEGCDECGLPHPKCRAHRQGDHHPCMGMPVTGTDLCRKHGGKTPQVQRVVMRRAAKTEALAEFGRLGVVVREDTTVGQIQALIQKSADFCDAREAEMMALPSLFVEETDRLGAKRLVVHPTVQLYNQERHWLGQFLVACGKLGLEDRRLQLAKEQGDRLYTAFTQAVEAAQLAPAQAETLRASFAAALRPPGPPDLAA